MTGDLESIKNLITSGINPNMKMCDWYDSTPLNWAASFNQLKSVIDLIRLGADPLIGPNKVGNTPKMDAKREGHKIVTKFLNKYEAIMHKCCSSDTDKCDQVIFNKITPSNDNINDQSEKSDKEINKINIITTDINKKPLES